MRTFAALLTGLALALPLGAKAEPPLEGAPPGYVSERLENGLRVTILPEQSHPVVSTQVWYHVGSVNEDPGTRGFAHLFEHMMFGATKNYGRREYSDHHHRVGGYENAFTTTDETVYLSQISPEHHDKVLEMEADRMVHLVLSEENLENEKKIVSEELRVRLQNDPMSRLLVSARRAVYRDHPYAYTPAGTIPDIAAATLEHSQAFYERHYGPRNAHVVIVGPVDATAKLAAVRHHFGQIPNRGETPPEVPPVPAQDHPEYVELREDLPPVKFGAVAYTLPATDSPDQWALRVLQQLLGGGQIDPFQDELVQRRRKAVFALTLWLPARRGGAVFFIAAYLPYRRESTALRLVDETLDKLAAFDWLDAERLASAKRTLMRREMEAAYYADLRATRIGRTLWWRGDGANAFETARRIDEVTLDQVRDVFDRYVTRASPTRIFVRPERIPLLVRLFSWVVPLVN